MFGHQDALAYGIQGNRRWVGEAGRSDIKSSTGQHPAVIGYDLGHLELDAPNNLDGVPFDQIRENIVQTYLRGGVNTISWHPNNPLDLSKTTWDAVAPTIPRILDNPADQKQYLAILDKLCTFFKSLKGPDGEAIPVLFRPYHEHTGDWFWWGAAHCSPAAYIAFWKLTVDYFRGQGVHNLLIAYSTDFFRDEAHYLERYPGPEYVDLLGFDMYHRNAPEQNSAFITDTRRMVATVSELGLRQDKLWAITETGLETLPDPRWWSEVLLPIVKDSHLTYVLVWRNGRPDHYYAPYPGQTSEADFKKVVREHTLLLEKPVRKLRLYQRP